MARYDGEILVERIRDKCKEKGISIAQMEKDLAWSQGLISRWTKNSPSVGKIMEVVSYLGISYEDLLGEGTPVNVNTDKEESLSEKLYRLTEVGKLEWDLCDEDFANEDVQELVKQHIKGNCKIYCASYERGFFLLIANMEEADVLQIGALRNMRGHIHYIEQDNESWMEKMLKLIDQDGYEEWDKVKTEYYVNQFMQNES